MAIFKRKAFPDALKRRRLITFNGKPCPQVKGVAPHAIICHGKRKRVTQGKQEKLVFKNETNMQMSTKLQPPILNNSKKPS